MLAIAPRAEDNLIEIGPGRGALTNELVATSANLRVIEIDRDFTSQLAQQFAQTPLEIVQADVLRYDFTLCGENMRLLGNLPYNISTPLLFHLLLFKDNILDMHFMLQKEVVDRLSAESGPAYGRLSVMMQYHFHIEHLFDVPPSAFSPPPAVTSAVARFIPRTWPQPVKVIGLLEKILAAAFSRRRKYLRNNLNGLLDKEQLDQLGIGAKTRAQELAVSDYMRLANALADANYMTK